MSKEYVVFYREHDRQRKKYAECDSVGYFYDIVVSLSRIF